MEIGDSYGGGIVVYKERGLGIVCATQNLPSMEWLKFPTMFTGATSELIGNSKINTELALLDPTGSWNEDFSAHVQVGAIFACNNLTLNDYSDWYLPTLGDIKEVYKYKNLFSDFGSGSYWTSTESDLSSAVSFKLYNGTFAANMKDAQMNVRPVRYFTYSAGQRSALDVVDILWKKLDNSPVSSAITGKIAKFSRPLNSDKIDVVINSLSGIGSEVIAEGIFNVNVHVPNLKQAIGSTIDQSQPDTVTLKSITRKVIDALTDVWGDDYNFTVQQDTGVYVEEKSSYNNLRIEFNSLNF